MALPQTTPPTNPDELAHYMGVRVIAATLPHGWWGAYMHSQRTIILRPDLGSTQRLCTLAHELGHAHYGHIGVTPKQELQANRWAARLLINHHDLIDAARIHDSTTGLAAELGVMPSVLTTYLEECHARTPGRIDLPDA